MNDFRSSHIDLQATAKQVMLAHGFEPDFPPQVAQQLAELKTHPPQATPSGDIRDLRNLLWSSIDNDTSKDLDQIEVAERLPDGNIKVLIGIADVDRYVPRGSAIDQHAAKETVTLYTGVQIFPMLPEVLSTGLTSLLENQDRACMVTEFVLEAGACASASCFPRPKRSRMTAGSSNLRVKTEDETVWGPPASCPFGEAFNAATVFVTLAKSRLSLASI